jgi:amino acid adenylation domain-containing protein
MTLLGLFQALLCRLSGSEDLVVGSPIAGRTRAELEPLIGFFVNTLVLRSDLSGDPGLRELLRRVKAGALAAYAHQDVPFERLVEELSPERDLGRTPFFQAMFSLQNASATGESVNLSGLELRRVPIASRTAKFELELALSELGGEILGAAEYSTDLFDRATIARLLRGYEVMLAGAVDAIDGADGADGVDAIDRPLSELPLFAASERHQMLWEWNDSSVEAPATPATPEAIDFEERFENQAARTPDAVAAACEGGELSFAELSRRAAAVASALTERGVGPGVLVALLAERGLDFLVAMLGVLKAGGVYLPLDPRHPVGRHVQVLEQTAAPVLLAAADLLSAVREAMSPLPEGRRPRHYAGIENLLASGRNAVPPRRPSPGDLAYVIFTSGSTGVPKGVMIERRGMLNHLEAKIRGLELSAEDRVAQTASQTFDISIWQMLAPLMVGGRLEIFRDDTVQNPSHLLSGIVDRRITVLETVPSLLRVLVEEEGRAAARVQLPELRWMIPTGEALPLDLCREWLRRYPEIPLVNAYGPTECADDVTHQVILGRPDWEAWVRVPIGRPLGNLRLHVLDRRSQLLPIGVAGELCVGGVGVGRGYFGEPRQTAATFVPDPFAREAGARLYRTGDVARQLPDGTFDLLGRIDHQVKVRGFRIELGEIEAALARHPALEEAVVIVREDRPGDRWLVAYAVAAGERPTVEALRRFLLERLPGYMIPAAFVFLDSLPLTLNGKLDRRALPAPAREADDFAELAAPRDVLELELIAVWQEVLRTQPIGIRDDFFELGGHSLLAVRLTALLRQRFGRDVPLAVLFQQRTIEGLAGVWRNGSQAAATVSPLLTLRATGSLPALFLAHPAGGGLKGYQRLAQHLGPEHPIHGFHARGLMTEEEPYATLEEMASAYVDALRRFQPAGPYRLGGMSMGALVVFEMARKLEEQGEELALLALLDPPPPNLEAVAGLPEIDDVPLLALFAFEAGLAIDTEPLGRLGDEERLVHVAEKAVEAGLVPEEAGLKTGIEFLRRTLKVFKGSERASQRYVPGAYSGRVDLLLAAQTMEGGPKPQDDGGWSRLCSTPPVIHTVPGNHNTILREPNVRKVAELLRQLLKDGMADE